MVNIFRKDTLSVSISDTHCGSPVGLMLPKIYQFKQANIGSNDLQKIIFHAFDDHTKAIGKMRKGKRLIITVYGDLVEGFHHDNRLVNTNYETEQKELFADAFDYGLINMGFNASKGDLLYFIRGTGAHAGENEEDLAGNFECVPFSETSKTHPSIRLNVNGVRIWGTHRLAAVGEGQNRGRSLNNKLRVHCYNAERQKIPIPDFMIGGHYHQHLYSPYAHNDKLVEGFILSPYKAKDDWTFGISPFGYADLGLHWINITADGKTTWGFMNEETEQVKEILV